MAAPKMADPDPDTEETDESEAVDTVNPDELGDEAPDPVESEPEPETDEVEQADEDAEPEVDPFDIDTVSLDPFGAGAELDELNEATKRAKEEAQADDTPDIDITQSSLGEESPFAGDEETSRESSSSSSQSTADPGPFGGASTQGDDELDKIIIEGFARAAVIKVEPKSEKDELQSEFEEVFESFRLGYFGREVIYEYMVMDENKDIDPIWGFFGSVVMCLVVVMWLRPDSDKIVGKSTESINNLVEGIRN